MKLKHVLYIIASLTLISCMSGHRPPGEDTAAAIRKDAPAPPETAAISGPAVTVSPESAAQSLKYEKQADRILGRLAGTRNINKALVLAGNAVDYFKKTVDLNKNSDSLVHKYTRAIELKYNLIIPDGEQEAEKQKVYADTLVMLEQLHSGENNSVYADYDLALLLILNSQYYIIFQVIGAVNRIHGLCEKIYKEDRSFENYSAAAALGRINFLAPNIPFLMGWPDKKISRAYLEEALASSPDSLLAKYFLADTLYALGEKDKAAGYFKNVLNAAPRHDINYFQDRKIQRNCALRMKELGIQ